MGYALSSCGHSVGDRNTKEMLNDGPWMQCWLLFLQPFRCNHMLITDDADGAAAAAAAFVEL